MRMSTKSRHLRRTPCPGTNIFQQHARRGSNTPASIIFGHWSANGHLLLQIALDMGMLVITALAMKVNTPGRDTSEAARRGLGTERLSVTSTRPSCVSFGKHKSQVSTPCSIISREVRLIRPATWEAGGGWIYWTWRVEDADEWSYQAGLNFGWIPWDPKRLESFKWLWVDNTTSALVGQRPSDNSRTMNYIPLDARRRAIR